MEEPSREYTPLPEVRQLRLGEPLAWLAAGWRDLASAPGYSVGYGALIVAVGYIILALSWLSGSYIVLFALVTGFTLVGPALAFALYDVSRELEAGRGPSFAHTFNAIRHNLNNQLIFIVVLLVILLVWARAAAMVHVFFPAMAEPTLEQWLQFLGIGSAVGAVFAFVVFGVSAFSLPMMMDRRADVISAVITSMRAVTLNKWPMVVWAALIVGLVVLGFATALLGLALVLPWVGHATWHAYRSAIVRPTDSGQAGVGGASG